MDFTDGDEDDSLGLGLKVMLAAAFCLFAIVFLIIIFHFYARRRRNRQQRRRLNDDQVVYQIRAQIAPLDVEPRSQGLHPSVIASLPKLSYKQSEQFREGENTECSVCLATIVEDTAVRILPNCKHLFHVDCVDKWFGSNTTCPICRTVAEPMVRSGHGAVQPTAPPVVENGEVMGLPPWKYCAAILLYCFFLA